MGNNRRILLISLLIAVLGAVAWLLVHPDPGPMYEGKPLTRWLEGFDPGSTPSAKEKANDAVRQLGTNAIPTLLRLLKTRDSKFKLNLIQLCQKQHLINFNIRMAQFQHSEALFGFECLGPRGKSAMPALIEIYNERRPAPYTDAPWFITYIFASIGPAAADAVPQLAQDTSDKSIIIRAHAVAALGYIHARPDLAVPALTRSLHDPNGSIQANAAMGLAAFGSDAKSAIPELIKALSDPSPRVRDAAASTLKKIDPEAAAKAGVK